MPYHEKKYPKYPATPEERWYEALNKISCALVAAVIVCHADTGLDKIEWLMGPWLPLLAAIVIIVRLPFRRAIDSSHLSELLNWIGIFTAAVMFVFAIYLRR